MGYTIVFLMISVLILVHEFGHFLAAKAARIPVRQFSIGYGPRLFGFTYRGTEYRISAVPVGGYVMPELAELDDYFRVSFGKRVWFAFAGPLANVAAAWAGLAVLSLMQQGAGVQAIVFDPFVQLWDMTAQFVASIPAIVSRPQQLSGIVGLVAYGKEVGLDVSRLLSMSVLLNINLAFLNLLPVLPLDGGKIVVDLMERLRLPVKRLYVPVALTGWAFILLLMVYVTFNDVHNLFAMA